ncbi:MAG: alanine dehydrogenase [Bdellovibrionales bacterium]|nr:alanine dehydrogenase [Bdellovibrionales bacterium]
MIIGVPRERKTLEKRVALTPDGAHRLIELGHTVLIETNAGLAVDYPDDTYREHGCKIAQSLEEVWTTAEMVVKVKEPHESEFPFFRPGLLLFDYLHLASMPEVTQALVEGGVTSIGYELVQMDDGSLPLLEPMSEIAGKLSVINGVNHLLSQNGGRGVLLPGALGVPRAQVAVIGAGISGRAASEMAFGMGAQVTVLDIDPKKLMKVHERFENQATTCYSTPEALRKVVQQSDLVIGAVLIPGAAAPKILTREMIAGMPKGSVFVDISIDQGGCAESSKTTSLKEPTFVDQDVIHYCVPNMPAQVARTSTQALTAATLPYVEKLASLGFRDAIGEVPELRRAVNTVNNKLTVKAVSEAVGIPFCSLKDAA